MNIRTALVGSAVALLAVVAGVPAATATSAASDPNCVSYTGYKVINRSISTTAIWVSKTKNPNDGGAWCYLTRGYSTRGLSFYVPANYRCDDLVTFYGPTWFPIYSDLNLYCHHV